MFFPLFSLFSPTLLLYDSRVADDFNWHHSDALIVSQFLIPQERDKLHHFAMGLNLSHVLFDGQLLALE